MKKSQRKWLWISITISLVVLTAVLYLTIDEQTIRYLAAFDPVYLVAALCLHLLALGFWGLRVMTMSRSLGYSVPFRYCLNLVFANMLVAAITPSQAGGEPVRIHELYRANMKIGDATAVVLMERVLDGLVLGVSGAAALAVMSSYLREIDTTLHNILILGWFLMVGGVILLILVVRSPSTVKNLLRRISCWIDRKVTVPRFEHLLESIDEELDNFHGSMARFAGRSRWGLAAGTFFTALFWIAEFLIASLILMGLGQPPSIIPSFIVQLLITILMLIPLTPGGSGVAEVSATSLYSLFVPSSIVGIFVLLWRIILYYINIIIGLAAGMLIMRREIDMRL
ncbi:MAG: lysylphosphatidylglycerol synthase transmembrane domain-containing protein [Methanoculleaceae archaeon]